MWTTWRSPGVHCGRDRLGDRDRALEAEVVAGVRAPRRSRAGAPRRASRPARRRPRAAASTPCPGFSWRQRRTRSCQRRSAETRIRGVHQCRDDPKPRTPRSESGSSSTSTSSTSGTGTSTSWAMRIPGSTVNARSPVGVDEVDAQLAAVARVDQPGRVHDRDAVLGGEPRARLDEAREARPGSRPRARSGRAPARRARARPARRRRGRGPASPA